MGLLFLVSIIFSITQAIKDAFTKPIPDEYCAHMELYYKDIVDGVPLEQCMKNLENGKYKSTGTYTEPHRNPKNGKIIIENYKLYYDDADKYGAWQAQQWAMQGKYNL